MRFERQMSVTINALYNLNLRFGTLLNDGLEDKIDQLQNLLQKQVNEMKPNE